MGKPPVVVAKKQKEQKAPINKIWLCKSRISQGLEVERCVLLRERYTENVPELTSEFC